ncbi:hypothetical protein VTO73DRAFT_14507 [Trametes versicolor]
MTTSSSSAASTQHAAEIQELTTNLSCAIATTALLLYDVLLTSGQEYRHIWRSRKSWFSRALCASVVWLTVILRNLNYIGPAMFTALRIYAVSRKNRVLGGVALALSMTPFVINMSTIYEILPINLPAPLNCTQANTASRSISAGISSILNSRFLLALHETNGRLEGATDMAISSISLNIGGCGDPEFLGIIGGSIHSIHGRDEDLDSLEFALSEREEEHDPEPEGEIVEGGRDMANLA